MRTRFILLVTVFLFGAALLCQAQTSNGETTFQISSRGTAYGVQGEFSGSYVVEVDSIRVNVVEATLYVSEHCPYQGRRAIKQITFGLATETKSDGAWKIESAAPPTILGIVMRPKETQTFSSLYFRIPRKKGADLARYWFVVEIQETALDVSEEKYAYLTGFAFAHSCKDIFDPSFLLPNPANQKPSSDARRCHQ